MHTLVQDIRYALRGLARSPGFAAIAVITLALGIGGNTAIFSVVNAVVLRPLDFEDPAKLVRLQVGRPVTPRQVDGLAERLRSYSAIAAGARTSFTLTGEGTPEEVLGSVVSEAHAAVFGVAPALGRAFSTSDAVPGTEPVAVLSHEFWQRRFGGDPAVVGRTIALGGEEAGTRTIIGVWPAGYAPFAWASDVFVPMQRDTESHLYIDMARFQVAARLGGGATYTSALQELRATVDQMSLGSEGAYFSTSASQRAALVSYQEAENRGVRGTLWLLLGAVGIVLLIACTNVTNLVLARSAARSHEFAVRTAIGAGRGRVVRQLLTESLVLASLGGALGGVGAVVGLPLVLTVMPAAIPRAEAITVDWNVLFFAAAVTVLAGVAFGLLPALRSTRAVGSALRGGGRGQTAGRHRFRLNRTLVAAQIGLCVVLVAASGLLLKSLWLVSSVDPGFDARELYTLRVRPAPEVYPDIETRRAYFASVLESVRAVPGVEAAGGIQILPMSRGNMGVGISPDGAPVPEGDRPTFVGYRMVTPDYGSAMGVPLIEGRWLDERDATDAMPAGMINERMAAQLFPDESPVGRTVHWNTGDVWFTVVGVIGDVHQNRLDEAPRMEAYVPMAQDGDTEGLHLMVRSSLGSTVLPSVRAAAWSIDSNVPITMEASMEDVVAASMADRRSQATLFTLFGTLALIMGAIGVYGVTSYTVSQRTHEMGVRLALGAAQAEVVTATLRSALVPVAIGLGAGLLSALVASRALGSMLYQVTPTDPAVLVGVIGFLMTVAVAAAWAPARRASRTDPMVVLGRN